MSVIWNASFDSEPNLGTYLELESFSETITAVDSETEEDYEIEIVPRETNPSTIIITNGITASISGYYFDSFTNELQYRTSEDTFVTKKKFEQIDITKLSEMIYYKADTNRTKVFTYDLTAGGETVTYTITVQNDWTTGKNTLQEYVGLAFKRGTR